ncbi:MAG: phosphoglucosamine mutase [Erysipelotrichaceae bacterium]|nr:phosphoglucosamine mutase [Erysipelotrichaceae bacterium]
MGKYFGTDGIRGKANDSLTVKTAFAVGSYLGYLFSRESKGKILIGRDTRISSAMFEAAITAGATAAGCDVYLLKVAPTPAIAYLVKSEGFDCGVMISASHNPYYDNGIKVFDAQGSKLSASIEAEIERYIDGEVTIPFAVDGEIGQSFDYSQGLNKYLDWMASLFDFDCQNKRVVIDCANGSAVATAQRMLNRFGCDVRAFHNTPDGININTDCGSTHPQHLQKAVVELGADVGFAFDGDADRLIAVDEFGNLIDGDKILYACGLHLKKYHGLSKNSIVTTVMSNLGLYKALQKEDINYIQTQVGDKYVYEQMLLQDVKLGGEQSGHIIFKDHATTGDGLLTAMKLLEVMADSGQSLAALTEPVAIFPQLLKNVRVNDKQAVMEDEQLKEKIRVLEEQLHGNGRILVRPSGTEPLVRVMVEAQSEELCNLLVGEVVELIKTKGL